MANLFKRDTCYDSYRNVTYNCNTYWNDWVRWLVLAIIIIAALIIFFLFSCISARRRRRMGHQPFRGTGWAVRGHGPVTYNAQPQYQQPYYNNSNNPPPAYTPAPNQGYYGQQSGDIPLQQPQQAYGGYRSGGENVYEPPKGPPPQRQEV